MSKPKTHNIKRAYKLEKAIKEYIDFIDNDDEYHEDREGDYKNDIYEAAMECFTDENIWDWINERR